MNNIPSHRIFLFSNANAECQLSTQLSQALPGQEFIKGALPDLIPSQQPDLIICWNLMIHELTRLQSIKKQRNWDHISIIWYPGSDSLSGVKIRQLYQNGVQLLLSPQDILMELLIAKIEGEINRKKNESVPPRPPMLSQKGKFLNEVQDYLNQNHLKKDFCIEKFGREMGMSRTRFFYTVKQYTGGSPSKLVLNFRLNQAADLLKNQNGNISDVAYRVGFSSPAYFSKRFKEKFGVQPSSFQKRIPLSHPTPSPNSKN